MFDTAAVMGIIPTTDFDRARNFYVGLLGLSLVSEDNFAIEVKSAGTHIRITKVDHLEPQQFTILGWRVDHILTDVRELTEKGIVFERYPWFQQDEDGIWTAPGGTQIAWFKDPDGNNLSLSQHVTTEVE